VLVALTLATVLLAVLLRGLGLGMTGSRRAERYVEATILAESTLDAMGAVAPLADGATADQRSGTFRVHATVQRYHSGRSPDEGGYVVPYELSVTVAWPEGRQERSTTLRTVRLGPPL
jgi:hypothetical protein